MKLYPALGLKIKAYAEEEALDAEVALIGDELVREGDTIDGVKVVQINSGKVKFEKNGKMWTQGTQERPDAAW